MGFALKTGVARSASIGILNQVVASTTNFGIAVYLVRTLEPAGFGLWGIGFSIVLLALGLANGLILTQMVVGLPLREPADRPGYLRSMFIGSLVAGLASVLLALFAGTILGSTAIGINDIGGAGAVNNLPELIFSIGIASAGAIMLHYFIRTAFSLDREVVAFILNIVLLLSLALLLAGAHYYGPGMSADLAMMLYAAAHVIAAIAGYCLLPVRWQGLRRKDVGRDLANAWQQGRWAMAGVWVSWGQSQAYVYLTPIFFGLAGLGAVNAARMIAAPLIMLIPAVNQIALPRFSRMQASAPDQMIANGKLTTFVLIAAAFVYAAVAAGLFDLLSELLLGSVRPDLFWIAMAWCLMAGLSLIRQIATVLMQSANKFQFLFTAEASMLCITVIVMLALFSPVGLAAGVLATGLGEALIALLVWRGFLRYKRRPRSAAST